MTLKSNIQATGASYGHSQAVCGELGPYVAATGSTQATAALLPRLTRHVVTSGSGGVVINPGIGLGDPLQDGDETEISNATGSDLSVYPPLGVAFSGSSTNAPITLATGYSVSVLILSSTLFMPRYYATASGAGSVNSVGLSAPTQYSVTNSPITSSGTIALDWVNQNANIVLAGPTSAPAAAPTFRALVTNDLPNTAVTPATYTNTTLTVDAKGRITAASNGSVGSGTVTSVGLSLPAIITVTNSPVTTTGTLTGTLATQTQNTVWAGPTSAPAAAPTFRALVAADLPGNVVTTTGSPANGNMVAFTGGATVSNSNLSGDVTTSGTLAATVKANLKTCDIGWEIDGGGSTITTGVKYGPQIDFDCTIQAWTILLDQSGSIVIDIWKDTYANYPPVDADSITASATPTVTTALKNTSTSLSGWTTTITAGDVLRYNVDSVTSATYAVISLKVVKT